MDPEMAFLVCVGSKEGQSTFEFYMYGQGKTEEEQRENVRKLVDQMVRPEWLHWVHLDPFPEGL